MTLHACPNQHCMTRDCKYLARWCIEPLYDRMRPGTDPEYSYACDVHVYAWIPKDFGGHCTLIKEGKPT